MRARSSKENSQNNVIKMKIDAEENVIEKK